MSGNITVVVVDDHEVVRGGIVECIENEGSLHVVGEGRTADDARRLIRELRPDVALLDINMPGGGIEAARDIVKAVPEAVIVFFSFRDDPSVRQKALEAGASGYLVKGISGSELAQALRRAAKGQSLSS